MIYFPTIRPSIKLNRNSMGLETETTTYLALSGVSLTVEEIAALDNNIKLIKYGSGIVLSSLTVNLSTVAGSAFAMNSSVDLRPYLGFKHSIAAGGKTLVGWGKAVGTAEALDSETITGWTNGSYGTFASTGANITSAITGGGGAAADSNNYSVTAGQLYKLVVNLTLNSGNAPYVNIYAGNGSTILKAPTLVAGAQNIYTTNTATGAATALRLANSGLASNHSSTWSNKRVTAPAATDITIVSTNGGATYNWTSNDGIDPNAASFTDTITAT